MKRNDEMAWKDAVEQAYDWDDYGIVIDTEQYAGNFERELCAACTGRHDDTSGRAKALAMAYDGPDFEDKISGKDDEHGCYRHATVFPTPGWSNDGKGGHTKLTGKAKMRYPAYLSVLIHLNSDLTQKQIDGIKERAFAFAKAGSITVTGFRMIRERTTIQSRPV